MKWSHKVIGTAVGVLVLAATGMQPVMADGSLDRIKKQGYVKTAVNQELPYAELKSNGEMVGVLPEVVEAVLAESGIGEFRGVLIDWGAMIPGLQARRYDMVSGGLFINPKRCKAIIFSEPILCDAEAFVKLKSNPLSITSFAELKNHPTATAATAPGSFEHIAAKGAGIPRDKLVLWESNIQNGMQLISTGRADVLLSPLGSAVDAVSKSSDPGKFEIIAPVTDVAAKRYLCATRPKYIDRLSPASVHSLNLQGGPMSNDEVKAFEKNPNLKQIIQVRHLDDSGKREGGETYPFSHFVPLLQRLVDQHLGNKA